MTLLGRLLDIFVVISCAGHHLEFASGGYCGFEQIPRTIVPTNYELEVAADLVVNKHHGQVTIDMYAPTWGSSGGILPGRQIVMHAGRDLSIKGVAVFKDKNRNKLRTNMVELTIKDICHDEDLELLVIELDPDSGFILKDCLTVQIRYEGITQNNGEGLVRLAHQSPVLYTRHADKRIGARKLFPCFDDPIFRVSTRLTVKEVPLNYRVISNTPIVSSYELKDATTGQLSKIFHFEPMQLVSISQVSFAIGDFTATSINDRDGANIHLIQTDGGLGEFSILMIGDVNTLMLAFFGQQLPQNMLNVISLNGIGKQFETNRLGFVVVDASIMSHEDQPELDETYEIVGRMLKMLAQQWIGNSVECRYADKIWFFEALTDWIAMKTLDRISDQYSNTKDYQMLYARNKMMKALELDASPSSPPVCPLFNNPAHSEETGQEAFRSPTSGDGASSSSASADMSVDRGRSSATRRSNYGMSEVINSNVFDPDDETRRTKAISIINSLQDSCHMGLKYTISNFSIQYAGQSVDISEFQDLFSKTAAYRPRRPMGTLCSSPNYPLIKVNLNPASNMLTIDQERFKLDYTHDRDNPEQADQLSWHWPIALMYGNRSLGYSQLTTVKYYSSTGQLKIKLGVHRAGSSQITEPKIHIDWVKVNSGFKGFYRVLYSDSMLDNLMKADVKQLTNVDYLNLLDDALALFKAGKVGAYYLVKTLLGVSTRPDDLLLELMAISYRELRGLFLHSPAIREKLDSVGVLLFWGHYETNEFRPTKLRFKQDIQARGNYYEVLAMISLKPLTEKALESLRDKSVWNFNTHLYGAIFTAVTRDGDDSDVEVLLGILDNAERSNELDIKIVRAMGHARDNERLMMFWHKIMSSKKHLISDFITSLLDSVEGDDFLKTVVLPKLPSFTRAELVLESERMHDMFLNVCGRLSDWTACEAPMRDLFADLPERLPQLQREIFLAARRRYFRQALEIDKLARLLKL